MIITEKNKWLIIIGAIIVQICIGTIYSWSLFNIPLIEKFGWSDNQVLRTYQLSTFTFAFSTFLSGKILDRIGPRVVTIIGGIFYGGGLILASTANSLIELYLFYGVLSGLGVGFVYVCPISTSVKWFPNKKGLITGIAVGAFGMGNLVFKYIIQYILDRHSITNTFLILGIIYMILILIGAQLLMNPKKVSSNNDNSNQGKKNDYNVRGMLKQTNFYFAWILFYIGCIGGLFVIGLASDFGVKYVGMTLTKAANAVVIIGIFNAFGRLLWGNLTDKLGTIKVIIVMFIITGLSMISLVFVDLNTISFFIILSSIALCFGGFLAVFPIVTEEYFGEKNFGSNYGVMYQAYGFAALTGIVLKLIDSFHIIFTLLTLLSVIGLMLSLLMKKRIDKEIIQ